MHALPLSTGHPLCWALRLNAFCGEDYRRAGCLLQTACWLQHITQKDVSVLVHRTDVWFMGGSPGLCSHVVCGAENGWNADWAFRWGFASITLLFLPPESSVTAASEYSWCEVKLQPATMLRPAGVFCEDAHGGRNLSGRLFTHAGFIVLAKARNCWNDRLGLRYLGGGKKP